MNDLDERSGNDAMNPTIREPGWTIADLTRALATEPGASRVPARPREAKALPKAASGPGFTLREAHAHEWVELASCRRPGYTLIVYRAGPGFLVRKKFQEGDLLHLRVCSTRIEVCRYLVERMNAGLFAKFVWGFLAKVA